MNIKALSQAVADAALKTVADTTNEADLEKNVAAATEALILAEIKKHVADEPLLTILSMRAHSAPARTVATRAITAALTPDGSLNAGSQR